MSYSALDAIIVTRPLRRNRLALLANIITWDTFSVENAASPLTNQVHSWSMMVIHIVKRIICASLVINAWDAASTLPVNSWSLWMVIGTRIVLFVQ